MSSKYKAVASEAITLIWFWLEWLLLMLGWTIGLLSYFWSADFFERSGSIIVLSAAIAEFHLRNKRERQLEYVESEVLENADLWTRDQFRPKVSFGQKTVTYAAHVTIIFGTIIWGYGTKFHG